MSQNLILFEAGDSNKNKIAEHVGLSGYFII